VESSVHRRTLLGDDPATVAEIVGLVAVLSAVQFGIYALYQDSALAFFGLGAPFFLFVLVLLSGWVELRTNALLLAALLPVLPVYVHFVHYFQVGQSSGAPYPQAAVEAVPFGVGVGVLVGVVGVVVANLARQYRDYLVD
jgi:hypothetical protein